MRTHTFFDEVDASQSQQSEVFVVPCRQDMRFLIHAIKADTDGNGKIFIDESFDGASWSTLENVDTLDDFYLMDSEVTAVKDSYFMGDRMRVRYEPNGTTTGTITVKMGYKTKV